MRWLLAMVFLINSCLTFAQQSDALSRQAVVSELPSLLSVDARPISADANDQSYADYSRARDGDYSQYWWVLVIVLLVIHNLILRKRCATQNEQQQVLKSALKQVQTELKQAKTEQTQTKPAEPQNKMANYDKLATLGGITAGVAHEVNNPNNFVNLSADMLGKELNTVQAYLFELAGEDADPEIKKSFEQKFEPLFCYLETIKDGTERIKIIVEGLRNYAQENDGDPKTIKVTELIESTVRLVQSQYKKTIEFKLQFAQKPEIHCYPSKLNQILMNLVINACHAIEYRNECSAEPSSDAYIGIVTIGCDQIQCQREGEVVPMVEITIDDTGCGMTDETKAKLFEPFYTTKGSDKGTGLGLSITADLVAEHHGQIVVDSKLNQGTSFKLRLPINFE